MNNKEKLNSAIDKDINKIDYYDKVVKKIEKETSIKYKVWKWSFAPICLAVIMMGMVSLNKENDELRFNSKDDVFKINSVKVENFSSITDGTDDKNSDAVSDIAGSAINLTYEELIKEQSFIANIKMPVPFNSHRFIKRYDPRGNFLGYRLYYWHSYNNGLQTERAIEIHFSEVSSLRSNKEWIDVNKVEDSWLNNTKLKIWQFDHDKRYYYIFFEYKNLYFNIRTFNISEEDLLAFLSSLLS